jgi:hypothetical protein
MYIDEGETVYQGMGRGGKNMKNHIYFLDQHPFTAPFDELVEHHAHISQSEAAHIETKKLGGMSRAELQTDMRRGRMFQSRIFDLLGDLI